MVKKYLLVIAIMVSGILSCCTDIEPHWNIDDFTITFIDDNGLLVNQNATNSDSLSIFLNLQNSFLSNVWIEHPFINSAYALSCEPGGHDGIKDKLSTITFSSNQDFNNIEAGENLNDLIISNHYDGSTTIEELIENLNDSFGAYFELMFKLTEKPTNNISHRFTIIMDFESGKSISTTSNEITWN